MISACFLPHPPLLLREYASLADPVAPLRAQCLAVLEDLAGTAPDTLVILTGSPRTPPAIDSRPPLGLRVAHELLSGFNLPVPVELVVPFDATAAEIVDAAERLRALDTGRSGVLVLGDGSARRGEKAPGHLDERSFEVDRRIAEALAEGDVGPLADLESRLASDLLIAGRAAWQVLAAAVDRPPDNATAHADDPFGVTYHVAFWRWESVG